MYYISYGSNMNLRQMYYRCPHSRVIGNGTINGWMLVFNNHADIIETNHMDDTVPVVVWDIDSRDLNKLDMYEGYPGYYIRRSIPVVLDKTGETVDAVVYVMTERRKGLCPPSDSYFRLILKGCEDNGIPTSHLYEALNMSCKYETNNNQYHPRKRAE